MGSTLAVRSRIVVVLDLDVMREPLLLLLLLLERVAPHDGISAHEGTGSLGGVGEGAGSVCVGKEGGPGVRVGVGLPQFRPSVAYQGTNFSSCGTKAA